MKTRLFVIALAATASLAACGAEEKPSKASSTGPSQEAQNRKVLLDYARCMREHGVDMPDPTFDENGGAQMRLGKGLNPESAKFQAAQKACEKFMKGPSLSSAGGDEK